MKMQLVTYVIPDREKPEAFELRLRLMFEEVGSAVAFTAFNVSTHARKAIADAFKEFPNAVNGASDPSTVCVRPDSPADTTHPDYSHGFQDGLHAGPCCTISIPLGVNRIAYARGFFAGQLDTVR